MRKIITISLICLFFAPNLVFAYDNALEVRTDRAGVKCFLDGEYRGETEVFSDLNILRVEDIEPGTHTLKCTYEGFEPLIQDFSISADETKVREVNFKKRGVRVQGLTDTGSGDQIQQTGTVIVKSKPTGASVNLDGNEATADCKFSDVSIGKCNVKVSFPSKTPLKTSFNLPANKTITVIADFFEETITTDVKYQVHFSCEPNAKLYIDGEYVGETPVSQELSADSYDIELKKDKYKPIKEKIEVTNNDFLEFSLKKTVGWLKIDVNKDDVTIFINGKDYNNQNRIELSPGEYGIRLKKEGYQPKTDKIIIEENKELTKSYTLKRKTGGLKFTIQPVEADVIMKKYGKIVKEWKGDNHLKNIPIGIYQLQMTCKNFMSETKEIIINEGEITEIDETLETGQNISITSVPEGAKVYYQDSYKGNTPIDIYMDLGEQTITMEKEGYYTLEENFLNTEGKTNYNFQLEVNLDKIRSNISSAKKKKYLWLLGSVVCAGVGGYYKYSADSDYDEYKTAGERATELHDSIETKDKIYPIAFGAAGACLIPTLIYQIKQSRLNNKLEVSINPEKDGASFAVKVRW